MLQRLVCEGSDHPQDPGDHSEKFKVAFLNIALEEKSAIPKHTTL